MSSPHFNSVTAIGCFLCYTYVLLASFGNSIVYTGGSKAICLVGGNIQRIIFLIFLAVVTNRPYLFCY